MKINFVGDIFGTSGYARHCKELFNALHKHCDKMHLETQKPFDWARFVNDAELLAIKTPPEPDMDMVCITVPQLWGFHYTDPCKRFYGFVVWEGTKVPLYWEAYINNENVDGIFVPSTHVKDAIENTFKCEKPIYIIPHGVDTLKFQRNLEQDNKDRPFTFVVNKGWNLTEKDRGGIPIALKAFANEFTDADNVRLILKINGAYFNGGENEIKNAFDSLNLPKSRSLVNVSFNNMTDKEIVNMYSESDCILNTSYAEGFHLPLLEGMACGCVPLTSYFGGQMDFCNKENSFVCNIGKFVKPSELPYENAEWFEIDYKAFGKHMRFVFDNKKLIPLKKELCLEKASEFGWGNSSKKVIDILNDD